MALNKFMHPRNRYKNNRPEFARLGEKYPEFQQFLTFSDKGKPSLDFKDPEALRALTCTLLKEDFDLYLDVPLDHIVPTVPLRLNYIHWLEDLLEDLPKEGSVWGIDIGCGTSCIYPLLGAKMNGWLFWALEVDSLALQYARDNVEKNNLGDHIHVIMNPGESLFLDLLNSSADRRFHFTMCNPPFFGNLLEAQGLLSSRSAGRAEPSSVSTADEGEMIVEGGEVEFVKRMIVESKMVQDRVLWFTSMLGKKASVGRIVAELKKEKVPIWTTTEFCQGKTMRWGVAWSYQHEVKKKHSPQKKRVKEKPPLSIPIPSAFIARMFQKLESSTAKKTSQSRGRQEKILVVAMAMEQLMKDLKMSVTKQASTKWNPKFNLVANKNTWSHQRRKRRQAKGKAGDQSHRGDSDAASMATGSRVNAIVGRNESLESVRLGVNPENADVNSEATPVESFSGCHGVVTMAMSRGNVGAGGINIRHRPQSVNTAGTMPDGETKIVVPRGETPPCFNGEFIASKRRSSKISHEVVAMEMTNMEPNNNGAKISVGRHGDTATGVERCIPHETFEECKNVSPGKEQLLEQEGGNLVTRGRCAETVTDGWRIKTQGDKTLLGGKDSDYKERPSLLGKRAKPVGDGRCATSEEANKGVRSAEPEKKRLKLEGDYTLLGESDPKHDSPQESQHQSRSATGETLANRTVEVPIKNSGSKNAGRESGDIAGTSGSWGNPTKHVHTAICMSSSDPGSGSDMEQGPLLECVMEVKLVSKGGVEVVFSSEPGKSKEVLHQVAQYVKNHIAREVKGAL